MANKQSRIMEEIFGPARRPDDDDDDDDDDSDTTPMKTTPKGTMKKVPKARNPVEAITGDFDLTSKHHISIYKAGAASIYPGEEKFGAESATMRIFIQGCQARGHRYGWDKRDLSANGDPDKQGIFHVPTKKGYVNIIKNYAKLSMKKIERYEKTYILEGNRKSQDNSMFHEAMMNSLTAKASVKIRNHEAEYTINGEPSALLLFKVIVRESHVDSGATAFQIRRQMASVSQLMPKHQWNIASFNEAVRELVSRLEARGEKSQDLLMHLFTAYLTCKDSTFNEYIKVKQRELYDGKLRRYTAQALMSHAEEEYKRLLMEGIWEAPSQQEEKIIAMVTKIAGKATRTGSNDHGKGNTKTNQKWKGGRKDNKKYYRVPDEELRKPPPKDKMHAPKVMGGKEFWWCHPDTGGKCDGWWRRHKPTGGDDPCRGNGKKGRKHPAPVKEELSEDKRPSKLARLQASLQAIMEDHE
jgi:hypothetical protein